MTWHLLVKTALLLLFKSAEGRGSELLKGLNILFALIWFFVELLVLTIVLYIAGLIVVGKRRALFSDAFIISLLGTVLSTVFAVLLPGWIALLISIFVWLLLIKRFYETGWLGALAVGILVVIIYLAILLLLALIFGLLGLLAGLLEKVIGWLMSMMP
ncbi:MAG: hypothetical protein QXF75_01220 [Candidatus Bathyarchaeia archaeon]